MVVGCCVLIPVGSARVDPLVSVQRDLVRNSYSSEHTTRVIIAYMVHGGEYRFVRYKQQKQVGKNTSTKASVKWSCTYNVLGGESS